MKTAITLSTLALAFSGLATAAPASSEAVTAALASREKLPAVAKSIKQVCSGVKDQRLCGAIVKSYISGMKDYLTGSDGIRLVEAAKAMNKASLCMSTLAPDLVSKETDGIRFKITPLSEAYLSSVNEEGDYWGMMYQATSEKDALRVNAEVMGMRLMQGSPSYIAEQITSGKVKIYQNLTPCTGL